MIDLKGLIRVLKTSPLLTPILAFIDLILFTVDWLAVLTAGPVQRRSKSLLVLRVDVLGDYILFRNYLRTLRQSARFRDYSITLCANLPIKSIAETFDSDIIDEFIWTDIYKLSTRPLYRFHFVRQLHRRGFEVVFCPTYSRVLVLEDFLAYATGAKERVGCLTDFVNIKRWEAWFGDRVYTRLVDSGAGLVFEMERNRRIMEGFLGESVRAQPPSLDALRAKPVAVPERYLVLSLGAGQNFRIWPARRFAQVATFIREHYPNHQIVLTGAPSEMIYTQSFLGEIADLERIDDRTGKLSLPELVYVLSKADLLIANETGIVHIAASTHTPTIVISQGKSLVRWHPYPAGFGDRIYHLYPNFVEEHRPNLSAIAPNFNPESPLSIEEITVERVTALVQQLLPTRERVS